jgi:hypothetical protein
MVSEVTCLLNSLGKLSEKTILRRLNFQLQELKVIRNNQCAVKKGHSRTLAFLRNIEQIVDSFNINIATVIFFL